jgi:hypothetical protein
MTHPPRAKVIFGSALGVVAATLMRSATARLFHDHLLVKAARTTQHTPFHQVGPVYSAGYGWYSAHTRLHVTRRTNPTTMSMGGKT